jgi:hypothetical protein
MAGERAGHGLQPTALVNETAQLIDGRTDTHLWARAYDERLADVITLQTEVARTIADQVKLQPSAQETKRLSASRVVNMAAHDEPLRDNASLTPLRCGGGGGLTESRR